MSRVSRKAATFTESVIREMTRLADKHGAINLAQGFPNFAAPDFIKAAACDAIQADINQYAVTWGAPRLRQAVAEKYRRYYGWSIDPDLNITICCGATECMIATMLGVVDPGDRVVVFEPFYENYGPDAIISGAVPIYCRLDPEQDWSFEFAALDEQIQDARKTGRVRALILNTPNNPTGKVFSKEELNAIAELSRRHDLYVITDEIYEHIVYDGAKHQLMALYPGMEERTITISGLSKTFSVTGWRLGYIIAPPDLSDAIRKMHDFLTVGAAAPLQQAAAVALGADDEFYDKLAGEYAARRDYFLEELQKLGFRVWIPAGAYYTMVDFRALSPLSDVEFVKRLIQEAGVAAVPGSSFFSRPDDGSHLIRLAFCKTLDVLQEAVTRLQVVRKW